MRHLAALGALLPFSLACAGLSGTVPEGTGHCAASERVYFSCPTAQGALSLCGEPGQLQFRAGPLGAPEDRVPPDSDPAAFEAEQRDYPQTSAKVVSTRRDGWRYDIHVAVEGGGGDMGPDPDGADEDGPGVLFAQDSSDHFEYVRCAQPAVADWAGLQALLAGSGP